MKELLKNTYGFIFEEALMDEIAEVSSLRDFNEGDVLIDFGDYIKKMPLLIEGAIKYCGKILTKVNCSYIS